MQKVDQLSSRLLIRMIRYQRQHVAFLRCRLSTCETSLKELENEMDKRFGSLLAESMEIEAVDLTIISRCLDKNPASAVLRLVKGKV